MSTFFAYLWAAYFHWLALMSAGPFVIDRLLRLSQRARVWLEKIGEDRLRWIWTTILLVGLFVAGFLAWKDEHVAREAAELRAIKAEASQAENRRTEELRNRLRRFYVEATDLINENTHLPADISKDDLSTHTQKALEWMQKVYQWTKQNLGDAAADTLTEGQPTMGYGAAHGSAELNNLLNALFPFRDNIKQLINSKMWDATQAGKSSAG